MPKNSTVFAYGCNLIFTVFMLKLEENIQRQKLFGKMLKQIMNNKIQRSSCKLAVFVCLYEIISLCWCWSRQICEFVCSGRWVWTPPLSSDFHPLWGRSQPVTYCEAGLIWWQEEVDPLRWHKMPRQTIFMLEMRQGTAPASLCHSALRHTFHCSVFLVCFYKKQQHIEQGKSVYKIF